MEAQVKRWHLYVVACTDDTLYTGVSTDVDRRIGDHNGGLRGAKYTRSRRPVTLVASWGPFDRVTAHQLEYRLKRCSRALKLSICETGDLEAALPPHQAQTS